MQFPIQQKFKLADSFIDTYKTKKPEFGFNGLGEFVYMRTYSRIKENGKNETWFETVRRVVEGLYSIQRQHIEDYRLGWNQAKAQKSAQEMYGRIFSFKMLPPGRGLWAMGSSVVMERGLSEALFNCSFISTENLDGNPGLPFANAMDFLMLGVGVGADTLGAEKLVIQSQKDKEHVYIIPDTREGWVESVRLLINSYFGDPKYVFDYTLIRKEGEPIKTFGGISSGSRPLIELHKTIEKVLSSNISKIFDVRCIADIMNAVGKAVVSGNVRRSAEILLGSPNEEFLDLKNYKKYPERSEIGWASNNTVFATLGMDYSNLVERIKNNGEPGLFWLENAKKYGRIRDSESEYKDSRVMGLNPCFAHETLILTDKGYVQIGELSGKNINLIDAEGNIRIGKVFKTGFRDTIRVRLSNKQEIICTPDHVFKDISGNEIKAKDSKGAQLLPFLSYPKLNNKFVLFGFMQGDGGLGRLKSFNHLGIEINIGKNDEDILALLENHKYTSGERRVYIQDVKQELVSLEFDSSPLPERKFPNTYDLWDKNHKAAFLQGCFSANGCINSYARITYKSTSKEFILKLKDTLEKDFEIDTYITTNKPHNVEFSNGVYLVKEAYDLNIGTFEGKIKFNNNINFYQTYKINTLARLLFETAPYVTSIKDGSLEEVYDFSLSDYHWGVINGFIAHNCGEITLESGELCNLVETFPVRHTDLDDFKRTIKFAYLAAKTVTLLNTGWAETNRVMLRNRRIGLSMTGIAQFISKNSLFELKEWMREGYKTAESYDAIYSDWFAIPRSIKLTTIKPSGTVSLLAGATPGIHFPESNFYIRRVRIAKNSPYGKILKKSNYKLEPAEEDPENTLVVEFPISLGKEVKTVDDVTMWEQLNLAAFSQEHWADNSVSATITFKNGESKDIATALNFFQFKLKAISFLPKTEEGAYAQMPYEKITEEKYLKLSSRLLPLDFSEMTGLDSIGEKYCDTDVCSL